MTSALRSNWPLVAGSLIAAGFGSIAYQNSKKPIVPATGAAATATAPASSAASSPAAVPISIRCPCGHVGIDTSGSSLATFDCHCSICRKASGRPSLPALAYKPAQLTFVNDSAIRRELPPGSQNVRLYCSKCGEYLAEDASTLLGLWGLPLHRVTAGTPAPVQFRIFYADRVADVATPIGSGGPAPSIWAARRGQSQRLNPDGSPYVEASKL